MHTVLICDADARTRRWCAAQLVELGCDVVELSSARLLSERVAAPSASVLILDLGVAPAERAWINQLPEQCPELSLVLLVSEMETLNTNACAALAASDVLIKPFSSEDLLRAVRRALGDVTRRRELHQLRAESAALKELVHDLNAALRQMKSRYDRLAECVPAGVLYLDAQGRIRFGNSRAAELFRVSIAALQGKPLGDLVSGDDQQGLNHALREVAAGKLSAFAGKRLRLTSGRIVELTVTSLGGANQQLQAVLHDVTRTHNQEEHLADLNRLERFAVLTSGVMHDVNNHLSLVSMAIDSLASEQRPESSLARELAEISCQTQRSGALFRNMLRFARADKAPLAELALGDVVRRVLPFLRSALQPRWSVTAALDEVPPVYGNADLLQQALLNLVINARKAQPDGGSIGIRLSFDPMLRVADTVSGAVSLSVSDLGPGLSPEEIAQIFNPSFTSRPIGDGTGLGLALVHQIVVDHGGMISVDSEPGKGCCFQLLLPPVAG